MCVVLSETLVCAGTQLPDFTKPSRTNHRTYYNATLYNSELERLNTTI